MSASTADRSDRLSRLRRRERLGWLAATPLVALLTAYALWQPAERSLPVPPPPAATDGSDSEDSASERPPLDVASFDVALWTPPPPVAAPVPVQRAAPLRPPAPPRHRLVAIAQDTTRSANGSDTAGHAAFLAAFYDPDAGAVVFLPVGEVLADGWRIAAIDDDGVRLEHDRGELLLALREDSR